MLPFDILPVDNFSQVTYIWVRKRTCLQVCTIYMILVIAKTLDLGVHALSRCKSPAFRSVARIQNLLVYQIRYVGYLCVL